VVVSALVENQTSVGLTSDRQGRKLFGPKSEIISDQHLQKRVGLKSFLDQFLFYAVCSETFQNLFKNVSEEFFNETFLKRFSLNQKPENVSD
jgi:hypothetical protein